MGGIHPETLLYGHGWIFLAPFECTEYELSFARSFRCKDGQIVRVVYDFSEPGKIMLNAEYNLTTDDQESLRTDCRSMFRLDEDFADFKKVVTGDPNLSAFSRLPIGRLLRSPTVFEDVVKTICTTNCSWSNTKRMCERLCSFEDGSFPTPNTIVGGGITELNNHARMGYRAEYVYQLSRRVLEGDLDPESWIESPLSERTAQEISSIRGVGEYALRHILFLVGDYSSIPIDSEVRSWLSENIFHGLDVADAQIDEYYERYNKFKFLAYKFGRIARRDNYIN